MTYNLSFQILETKGIPHIPCFEKIKNLIAVFREFLSSRKLIQHNVFTVVFKKDTGLTPYVFDPSGALFPATTLFFPVDINDDTLKEPVEFRFPEWVKKEISNYFTENAVQMVSLLVVERYKVNSEETIYYGAFAVKVREYTSDLPLSTEIQLPAKEELEQICLRRNHIYSNVVSLSTESELLD